jgi:hypothetical protein
MLKINCKKSYYTFDKNSNTKNDQNTIDAPLPIFTSPHVLTFEKWKEKYDSDIKEITESFLYMIMNASCEKYICHINIGTLKDSFIRKLYKTSYNREKRY